MQIIFITPAYTTYTALINSHPVEGWRRNADGVVKITTYTQHGLVNIAKKKRELKSSQMHQFEEIFYYEIRF